ncbi:MAG TPA: histidine phosphatase family protein [Xanthomonadales bacterium]|nr:histidine phosphatase family protein [Xanthomonadales bacterium]
MATEELILVRHAHAERDAASSRDIDRPLSTLGFSQAEAAAAWLMERQIRPARVLCSPATRARQTLAALRTRMPDLVIIDEPGIYEATPGELIALVDSHRSASPLVVVGHNPGLETLMTLLADGRSTDGRGMPTGSIARLRLPTGAPLEPGCAELVEFWWP